MIPAIKKNALESFPTILSIRSAWMWEVQKMQENFSVTPSIEINNEKYKNKCC